MSRRRKWDEPYRRTFRAKDRTTGAVVEMVVTLCPINERLRMVEMHAEHLPASRQGVAIYESLSLRIYRNATAWKVRMVADEEAMPWN